MNLFGKKGFQVTPSTVSRFNSFNYHVLGAGQFGSNLAREMEDLYGSRLSISVMNTNKADIDYIKGDLWDKKSQKGNKLLLGDGGTGRSIKVGTKIVEANKALIREFVLRRLDLCKPESGYDFIVLLVGLGGGTGSSFLKPLVAILKEAGQKIVLFASLPTVDSALPALPNAGLILKEIQDNRKDYANIFLCDNDLMLRKVGTGGKGGYWSSVNQHIAKHFVYMMNINNMGQTARSFGALDARELIRVVTFGNGFGDFRVFTAPLTTLRDSESFMKQFLEHSPTFLDRSYLNKTSAAAVSILVPHDADPAQVTPAVENVFKQSLRLLGNPPFILKGVFENESLKNEAVVMIVSSGSIKPPIVDRLIKLSKRSIDRLNVRAKDQPEINTSEMGLDSLDDNFLTPD